MPRAIFLGQLKGKQLSEAYASSDLFVFPSTTETFGNVTLEAMASGIPPVCANKGGASGFIQEHITGLLAKPRDAEDLAEKIEFLLDHPEQREEMAKQAFIYSQEQTWEKSFEKILLSYKEVCQNYASKQSANTMKPKRRISQFNFRKASARLRVLRLYR